MLDLVLVNGLPGSGKTTLAAELAQVLHAPLISKDAIKEAFADVLPAAAYRTLGIAAGEMMWTLAAAMSGEVIVESWWFKPRDQHFVEAGLRRCTPTSVVELWCDVPAQLAKTRYAARRRHRVHNDGRQLLDAWPRWEKEAAPIGICPVIPVDTSGAIDLDDLEARIKRART
ncbi:AAA family ATPase [Actinoplanes sp. NPDC051343]|uniref:AAA family ATPase n=1 Tax=Actinoplanes sp. NPDC051343 TaxID=3363906 RepID=UPI0037BE09D8